MLVLALAGCATLIQTEPGGSWVGVEPGGTVTLHRAVTVPQGRSRVWLVNGRLSRTSASYRTACALELRRLSGDDPQQVPAGTWRIRRIQSYWTEVVAVPPADDIRFRLAGHGDSGDSGYSMIRTGYHFWLEDDGTGGPVRLTCLGILADPPDADPPSLADIAAALGSLATLTATPPPDAR